MACCILGIATPTLMTDENSTSKRPLINKHIQYLSDSKASQKDTIKTTDTVCDCRVEVSFELERQG
jgi:hypothetical protein